MRVRVLGGGGMEDFCEDFRRKDGVWDDYTLNGSFDAEIKRVWFG